jgi:hypothetical protein
MTRAIRHSIDIAKSAVRVGTNLLRGAVGLLATAPDPTPEEDVLNSAIRGGELNYRTGQFDDGTESAGWYERD